MNWSRDEFREQFRNYWWVAFFRVRVHATCPAFFPCSLWFISFIVWMTFISSITKSLRIKSGLVQTETISGRGHPGGIIGPSENLRRKDFQVAGVNHIAGESIGCWMSQCTLHWGHIRMAWYMTFAIFVCGFSSIISWCSSTWRICDGVELLRLFHSWSTWLCRSTMKSTGHPAHKRRFSKAPVGFSKRLK